MNHSQPPQGGNPVMVSIDTIMNENSGSKNEEVINDCLFSLAKNIELTVEYESFYTLPLDQIFTILSKVDISSLADPIQTIKSFIQGSLTIHSKDERMLNILKHLPVNDHIFDINSCLSILSLFKDVPIFATLCNLKKEEDSSLQVDYDFMIANKDKEIQALKYTIEGLKASLISLEKAFIQGDKVSQSISFKLQSNKDKTITVIPDKSSIPRKIKTLPEIKINDSLKLVVLSSKPAPGKTSIIDYYVTGAPNLSVEPTLGASYSSKSLEIQHIPIDYQIWDVNSHRSLRDRALFANMYTRNANVIIFVIDLTDSTDVSDLEETMNETDLLPDDTCRVLVGNKCDIRPRRKISTKEGEELAHKYGFEKYFETSALTGEGINEMFEQIPIIYIQWLISREIKSKT